MAGCKHEECQDKRGAWGWQTCIHDNDDFNRGMYLARQAHWKAVHARTNEHVLCIRKLEETNKKLEEAERALAEIKSRIREYEETKE